jgi:hypothetical protein
MKLLVTYYTVYSIFKKNFNHRKDGNQQLSQGYTFPESHTTYFLLPTVPVQMLPYQ